MAVTSAVVASTVVGSSLAGTVISVAPVAAAGIGLTGGLLIGGAVIAAAGIGLSAVGQAKQLKAQQAMAKYNEAVKNQQAKEAEAIAQFKQRKQSREASRTQASLRAGLGLSGVVSDEGTPLLLQGEQAFESEQENLIIGYQGQVGANRARAEARLAGMQADAFGSQVGPTAIAGGIGAGSSLLSGFAGARFASTR